MYSDDTFSRSISEIKVRLDSLSSRINKFEDLKIKTTPIDIPFDLLDMVSRIISHAENEIEDIYQILYRIKLDQIYEKK